MQIIYGDICDAKCDVIVNASNGIGYMGGKKGIKHKLVGIAEAIHFKTQGQVEKVAKEICKKHSIFGYAPGNVFTTPAFNLECKYIIHAVTMRFPGSSSRMSTIKKLLVHILDEARRLNIKSIALPMLGTGTGGLKQDNILKLYQEQLANITDIDIFVYIYRN